MDIGAVRLTERHLRADPPTVDQVAAAEDDLGRALETARRTVPVEQARTFVEFANRSERWRDVAAWLRTKEARKS